MYKQLEIYWIDVSRIDNKQGTLEKNYLNPIKEALDVVLGLESRHIR